MTETVTSSRLHVLNKPIMKPGKCAICGSADKPVIDFGFDVHWQFGRFYLCVEDCAAEVAYTIGFVPRSEPSQSPEIDPNTVVIPREQFRILVDALGGLGNTFADYLDNHTVSPAESVPEAADDVDFLVGKIARQDDKTASGEGSDGVPSIGFAELE